MVRLCGGTIGSALLASEPGPEESANRALCLLHDLYKLNYLRARLSRVGTDSSKLTGFAQRSTLTLRSATAP